MSDITLEREAMLAGRSRSTNVRRFQYFADWELCQMARALEDDCVIRASQAKALLAEVRQELRDRKATTY